MEGKCAHTLDVVLLFFNVKDSRALVLLFYTADGWLDRSSSIILTSPRNITLQNFHLKEKLKNEADEMASIG